MKNLPSCLTRQEIANLYGIDRSTFYRWCKSAGLKLPRGLLRPNDVARVFEVFGKPIPLRK